MPSVSSPVKVALESYVAGRLKAERLVIAVSAEYYREARDGRREALQPLIDVIDRASPGIVELGIATGGPGFDIRLAERPFPKQYEAPPREAAEAVRSGRFLRSEGGEASTCIRARENQSGEVKGTSPVAALKRVTPRA